MKIAVWTGHTKARADTLLLPIVLGEEGKDRVFFLLHCEGRATGMETLREECVNVLTHAVLDAEGEGYDRLESALKELNGLLKGFLLSEAVREVHAVVGLLEREGALHLSHVGRAEAYVVRDGAAIQVTEYYRGRPPSAFMHIVSGTVQTGDHFIIATQRLLRAMTPAQLTSLVRQHEEEAVHAIVERLTAEKEMACVLQIGVQQGAVAEKLVASGAPTRRTSRGKAATSRSGIFLARLQSTFQRIDWSALATRLRPANRKNNSRLRSWWTRGTDAIRNVIADLSHPERKRRAHLLLLAGAAAIFIIIWMIIQLSLSSQRSQTRGELQSLITQITSDLSTAENRQLAGDSESANAILTRADERARQVIGNESGLYRSEALELLDRIKAKREEINRIVRVVTPRVMANLSGKKADILAQGFIGNPSGSFTVFDRQSLYRVTLNAVQESEALGSSELILDGADFSRQQSEVFLTTGNSIIEVSGTETTTMKTEDPAGWIAGADIETYLRYLYVLSPERKQIYKYERLNGKYGPPTEYNVSGDLAGALDMTINGPVYVLRDTSTDSGGSPGSRDIVKLLRGEKQTFTIRNLPPDGLQNVSKIFKSSSSGNFYFLDPDAKRILVTTNDGDIGDSLYLKQYVLDSEQVGQLKDLYVDPQDERLYVLDEKRIYAIDLQAR